MRKFFIVGRPSFAKLLVFSLALGVFVVSSLYGRAHLLMLSVVESAGGQNLGPHMRVLADALFSLWPAVGSGLVIVVAWTFFVANWLLAGRVIENEKGDSQEEKNEQPAGWRLFTAQTLIFVLIGTVLGFGISKIHWRSNAASSGTAVRLSEKYSAPKTAENVEVVCDPVLLMQEGRKAINTKVSPLPISTQLAEKGFLCERDAAGWRDSVYKDILAIHGGWTKTKGYWVLFGGCVLITSVIFTISAVLYKKGYFFSSNEDEIFAAGLSLIAGVAFAVVSVIVLCDGCQRDFKWQDLETVDVARIQLVDVQSLIEARKALPQMDFKVSYLVDVEDPQGRVYAYVLHGLQGGESYVITRRVMVP